MNVNYYLNVYVGSKYNDIITEETQGIIYVNVNSYDITSKSEQHP